jgi:hypothetical protein
MKMNCWEFKKCGREMGGLKAKELGVCPSATELRLNGVHGGRHGGRACWVIAGTYCKGEVQSTFATKYANCSACEFYVYVKKGEGSSFVLSPVLLQRLR